jgi:hypothetical protein
MSSKVRWKTPPDPPRGPRLGARERNQRLGAQLRSDPGKWAVVFETASQMSAASCVRDIKHGIRGGFRPAGAFEAVARKVYGGGYEVYARFVGDPPTARKGGMR